MEKRLEAIEKKKQKSRVTKNTKKGLNRPRTAGVRSPSGFQTDEPKRKEEGIKGEMRPRYKGPLVNISFIETQKQKYLSQGELSFDENDRIIEEEEDNELDLSSENPLAIRSENGPVLSSNRETAEK